MTAPVASGWSELPGGIRTHWKAPPFHGAHPTQTLWDVGVATIFQDIYVDVEVDPENWTAC